MHSFLIVGSGSIGERHLRCFQRSGRAAVTACDTSPALLETIAKTYEVPTVSNWETALVSGKYDACVICTPAHLHVSMATRALSAGLHVLIEKPLAQSMDGVNALISLQRSSGLKAAVAYVLHQYPILAEAREFLARGELGPIRQVVSSSGQYFPGGRPAHAVHYSKTYYRDRKMGGGAIQDALTHTVNFIESVVGATDSVLCDCSHQVLPDVEVEDTVHISARNGETLVSYALNQFQAPNETTLQFNTAQGSLKIELHLRRFGILRLGESAWSWREFPALDRDAPFLAQANAFLDLLDGRPSRVCTLQEAVDSLRFNLAALRSAETGSRVRCADVTS